MTNSAKMSGSLHDQLNAIRSQIEVQAPYEDTNSSSMPQPPVVIDTSNFELPSMGDSTFEVVNSKGERMLFKDKRKSERLNPSNNPEYLNGKYVVPLPGGNSYEGPITPEQQKAILDNALLSQKRQADALRAHTALTVTGVVVLLVGMFFGIKHEVKTKP